MGETPTEDTFTFPASRLDGGFEKSTRIYISNTPSTLLVLVEAFSRYSSTNYSVI